MIKKGSETSLMCIKGELSGGGSVAVAVARTVPLCFIDLVLLSTLVKISSDLPYA